jgi:hypothetical protein
MAPPNCTCDGGGICTACTLASYENDPYSRSVDLFLAAQRQPVPEPNVIPIRASRRAV